MRKTLILIFLTIFFTPGFAQVQFESLSFDEALARARQSGKMLFLQFESLSCDQCNEVADKAFEDKKLGDRLNAGFICVKIDPKHPDRNNIASLYDKENSFGSLFISSDGALIHVFPKSTTMKGAYSNEIDQALTKAGEGFRLDELEKQRKADNKNIFLTEQLLLLRKSLYLDTDSLLDEYVSIIPADSLQSLTTLRFITQQAPIIGGKSDLLLRKNYALFLQAWNSLTLPEKISVNNRIIHKSMRKAIREKDITQAYKIAAFARNTHNESPQSGTRAYDYNLLEYYRQTKDTLNYLVRVINYYDNYYMIVNVDSVKRKDSLSRAVLLSRQEGEKTMKGDSVVYKKTISFAPSTQVFTRNLNEGAWTIYTWSNDLIYLKKALQWASRATEFFESPEAIDMYARLLYKTGNTNEAIQQEMKAIDLKKKRGFSTAVYEKVLANMQAGKTVIDI